MTRNTVLFAACVALVLAPGAGTAHEGHDHGAPAAPLPATDGGRPQRQADGSVFVPKPVQRTLQLRTAIAEAGEFAASVALDGRVIADPAFGGRVQAAQPGRVEAPPRGLPRLGQAVRRGELLATLVHIEDPVERARQQVMLHEVRNQLDVALKRQRRHVDAPGYFPRREVEETRLEIASLQQRMGDLQASITSREPLHAPADGIIATAAVMAGQVVEARELIFEIIDPGHLMVEAQAFDPALPGRVAAASAQAGATVLPLRYAGGGRALRDGALPLRFAIDGRAAAEVVIGQPVRVVAQLREKRPGVAVPAAAVVSEPGGASRAWVHRHAEVFEPRRVTVEPLDAQRLRVTAGLAGGERVVVDGAGLLGQVR